VTAIQSAPVVRTDLGTPRLGTWAPAELDDDDVRSAVAGLA
jgi:hypothetical protein